MNVAIGLRSILIIKKWTSLFIFLTLICPLLFASKANGQSSNLSENLQSISSLLSKQDIIRVWITKAPGNGHQAATINGMIRLRELGFMGSFEVVYHDGMQGRLSFLLPGFNPKTIGPQSLEIASLGRLKVVSESQSQQMISDRRVWLGFTGAIEEWDGKPFLEKLNIDIFVQLQPRNWDKQAPRNIYSRHRENIDLSDLHSFGIRTAAPTDADLLRSVSVELESEDLKQKQSGLDAIIRNIERVDVMPVYGLGVHSSPDDKLGLAALALQYANAEAPELFRKPVLIPVFSEVGKDTFGNPARTNIDYTLNKVLEVESFDIHNLPRLNAFINLNKFAVAVVFVGKIPPTIFHGIFARATLPAYVAGKNLVSFMADLGLPFISTVDTNGKMDEIHKMNHLAENIRASLTSAHNALTSMKGISIEEGIKDPASLELSKFIVELRKRDSKLLAYFQSHTSSSNNFSDDLLFQAMERLEKSMMVRDPERLDCKTFFSK